MEVKGIATSIVEKVRDRTNSLSQGRNAGCLGLVNEEGIIDCVTEVVDGGISGLPLRQLLNHVVDMHGRPIVEGLAAMPDNAVLITSRPGKSGLITDVSGVNFFELPIVSIGLKQGNVAGVGIIHPDEEHFDLSSESEQVDLQILAARSMNEEREILRRSTELSLRFLELSQPLEVIDYPERQWDYDPGTKGEWHIPRYEVNSMDADLAQSLVDESIKIGQGREVAAIAFISDDGKVMPKGKIVAGGIGYVPSRIMASSTGDITGKSLKEVYVEDVPDNAIFVHTHPGGTGVMHIGDANAGPGTWGRPIIAIGHDKDGVVRGATVIESSDKLFALADEDEDLGQRFFDAKTPEEEAEIRNRKFGIAQEYTSLCKAIEMT